MTMNGKVNNAVHANWEPCAAPAWEYVAMPEGSSSGAPVVSPGPKMCQYSEILFFGFIERNKRYGYILPYILPVVPILCPPFIHRFADWDRDLVPAAGVFHQHGEDNLRVVSRGIGREPRMGAGQVTADELGGAGLARNGNRQSR